jgi:hypothetical protein
MTAKPSAGELALEAVQIIEKHFLMTFGTERVNAIRELAALRSDPARAGGMLVEYSKDVTSEHIRKMEDLVRPEFAAGNWVDVEAGADTYSDGWRDLAEDAIIDRDRAERLLAQAGANPVREPVPLADHDEIGRKIFNQPWEIQKAICTIAAHCTVLTDDLKVSLGSAMIADLAGCISQCCLDLANALASPPSVVPDGYDHEPTNHMFECPGCGIDCADMNEQHKPGCPRATPSVPGVERGKDVRRV